MGVKAAEESWEQGCCESVHAVHLSGKLRQPYNFYPDTHTNCTVSMYKIFASLIIGKFDEKGSDQQTKRNLTATSVSSLTL